MTASATIAQLYAFLRTQVYTAAAALFFNGICLLLFSFAVFYLLQVKTQASRLFLALAVLLVLFALAQAILDVAVAAEVSKLLEDFLVSGSAPQLSVEQTWARLYIAREAMLSFNNAFSDSILLYRCSVIWSSSPYHKFVVGVPSIFILTTFALGLWGTFITVDTSAPFVMALVTNLMLLVLSAGRIWRKGRQASVVLGPEQRRRYNSTVEIICESSLLYLLNVTVYTVASIVEKKNPYSAPVTALSWGSLAQVVNIVPMMIMVRVGIAKSLREPDPPRVFYGGNGRRASDDQLGMALLPDKSKATAKYGQIGQPSGI